MANIESDLWKAAQLVLHSKYMPMLVQAAAWYVGKEYTEHMLRWVSTRGNILENLHIPANKSVDQVLIELFADSTAGATVDSFIVQAVTSYVAPTPPQGG